MGGVGREEMRETCDGGGERDMRWGGGGDERERRDVGGGGGDERERRDGGGGR